MTKGAWPKCKNSVGCPLRGNVVGGDEKNTWERWLGESRPGKKLRNGENKRNIKKTLVRKKHARGTRL